MVLRWKCIDISRPVSKFNRLLEQMLRLKGQRCVRL